MQEATKRKAGDGVATLAIIGQKMAADATLSLEEMCEWSGLSIRTIHAEIGSGRLRSHKIGRRRVVTPADARAWRDAFAEKASA